MATIKQIKDSAGTTHDIVDTKNTAGSTNSSSKLFLIGATEQAANKQTYSNSNCYTSNGRLYSSGITSTDNLVLSNSSTETPKIIFQRNTSTDSYYDYQLSAETGGFKFSYSSTSGQGSVTNIATIDSSGNYSGNAATASKLGTSTIGASNRPIYLNAGTPTACNVGEAFLNWGGTDFANSYGPIDAAMIPVLGANRLAFAKPDGISIEYSRDGGATWIDYEASDSQKISLTTTASSTSFILGKNTVAGGSTSNYMLRITFTSGLCNIYTEIKKFALYVSTSGSSLSDATNYMRCTLQIAKNGSENTFTDIKTVKLSGWSGWNIINTSLTMSGSASHTTYANKVRFIFSHDSCNASYLGGSVIRIFGFGGVGWTTPSTLASTGDLYSYDTSQNMILPTGLYSNATTGTSNLGLSTKYWKDGYINNLYIGGSSGNTTSKITSDTKTNMYISVNGTTPFIIDASTSTNPIIRASTTLPSKVSLGTSTVPFKDIYADKFNGYTIEKSVPSDAKFTDTTYSAATTSAAGLMSAEDKTKLNGIKSGAEPNVQSDWSETNTSSDAFIKNKPTIPTIPSDAVFTDYQTTSDGHYTPSNGNIMSAMDSGRALSFSSPVITSISTDTKGHITNITTSNLPTNPNTDTKNTAGSTNSSSKLYLIGATSQAANPQTYSHDTTYVGTDGCLYSNSQKVITVSDTVTTTTNGIMSARDKAKLDGIATNANNYSLPTAKYNTLGGLKPAYTSTRSATLTTTSASNTDTPTISSKSTEEGRYFAVEADANGVPYVNVPEATHRFSYTITSSAGLSSAAALTYVSGSGTYNAGSIIRIDFNGNAGASVYSPHWFKYTKNGFQYNFKVGRFSSDGTFIDASDDVSGIATGNISTFFTKSFALFRVISITSATNDAQKILMTPIYYSSLGQLSSNSIVSENINVCPNGDNSSYNLLFTSNITTDASEYKTLYTASDNSLSYNPSTNILNVPSIISSSSCSFGSNTNVKSIFNIKGSNHSSDVISLVGNSSTVAPYVSIRSAGSSTESIRLSGSKSSAAPYISIKTAGSATESIKLTGRTSTAAPSISIKSAGTSTTPTESIKLTGSTSSAAPSISIKSAGTSTTPTEGIKLTGSTSSAAPSILINTAGKDDVGIKLIGCANNTPAYITVYSTDGKYTNITGGSAPYTSSDERLKNFKDDVEVDFDKLKQIPKKYFTWKDGDQTKLEMGTSAQEVEKLYPNIVQEIDGYKSIEYAKLSIIALAAIDKLNERIEYLENKLKELE